MGKETECNIRLVLILGSVRPGNYTSKAAALMIDEIGRMPDIALEVIDPAKMALALPGQAGGESAAARLKKTVEAATGIYFVTPEYHGGMSSVTKLVIDNLGFPSMLAGKPMALLGVAAGSLGAVKALEQVRSVCSHVGALVLPGVVSVANVQSVFDREGRCGDAAIEKRIRDLARSLVDYIHDHVCPKFALEAMAREQSIPTTR